MAKRGKDKGNGKDKGKGRPGQTFLEELIRCGVWSQRDVPWCPGVWDQKEEDWWSLVWD